MVDGDVEGPVVTLDWQTAEWADGPKLMAWLDEKEVVPHRYGSFGRRATDWRRGSAGDFYTVDRLLCAAGLHPSDVPDDVWRGSPVNWRPAVEAARKARPGNRNGSKLSSRDVFEIRREVRLGRKKKDLAARFGVSPKTISNVANGWTWGDVREPAA